MKFSIITPSFNSAATLGQCIRSIADQGVEFEHIIQDACSTDTTKEVVKEFEHLHVAHEKDDGMYDAINRGIHRADGDIFAWLNCDEQYLPGTLPMVAEWFAANPQCEMLVGGIIVTRPDGSYLCDRKPLTPTRWHTMVSGNLAYFSAAAFFRLNFIRQHQCYFDPAWKVVGDSAWTLKLLDAGIKTGTTTRPLSSFTYASDNLSNASHAAAERERLAGLAPSYIRQLKPLIVTWFRLRRVLSGSYFLKPHSYAIFTADSGDSRQPFTAQRPTHRWPG